MLELPRSGVPQRENQRKIRELPTSRSPSFP